MDEGDEEDEDAEDADRPLSTPRAHLVGHKDSVYAIAIAPHSNAGQLRIATGSGDDTCALWSVAPDAAGQGQEVAWTHVSEALGDSVVDVAFSADGGLLAAACLDARVHVFDAASGAVLHVIEGAAESVECVRWHPRGRVLLAGDGAGGAWLWSLTAPEKGAQLMQALHGHGDVLVGAEFTPDGKRIVTASADGTARVWDPVSAATLHTLSAHATHKWHHAPLTTLAVHSADAQRTLIATGCAQGTLCLSALTADKCTLVASWSAPAASAPEDEDADPMDDADKNALECVAFVRAQPWVACASLDATVRVYDLHTTQLRHSLAHSHGVVRVVALAQQPALLLSATLGGDLVLWDVRSGQRVRTYAAHHSAVLDVAVREDSASSAWALSAADDGTMCLWDLCSDG